MKICQPALLLACTAALWCGCVAAPPSQTNARKNGPPFTTTSTNAATQAGGGLPAALPVATQLLAEEEEPVEVLPFGKGNPEALAHFAAGESLEAGGQHDPAMEEFYTAVMADPGNEKTARDVAEWLLERHHADKAVTLLSKVARRPEVSATILSLLARSDLQAGKTNAALAASAQAIARRPDSLQSYEIKLEVLVQSGKLAEALRTLDQAAKNIRDVPGELITLANLYAACRGPEEKEQYPVRLRAVALLDRAANLKISSPSVWRHMADAYERLGESKRAADIYYQLLAQAVDSPTLRDLLHQRLGEILLGAHDITNADAQFQAIVKDDPVNYPQAWYYLGILDHSRANFAAAVSDFQNAIRSAPELEPAYYQLALVLADAGRGDTALQILDQARQHFRDSFDAQFNAALVNLQLKDFDQAARCFTNAENLARSNNPARLDRQFYFQAGAACERGRQFKQAEYYLQKCIDMGADNAEALNYLGFMWADRGENLSKARVYIEKACKLEPTNAAYLDSMGWVLFKLKQPGAALPWLSKAVDLSPEPDPTILDHLGDVYLSLRQLGKAMENWKKSLAVEPNEEIHKKLLNFDGGST